MTDELTLETIPTDVLQHDRAATMADVELLKSVFGDGPTPPDIRKRIQLGKGIVAVIDRELRRRETQRRRPAAAHGQEVTL